MPQRFWHDPHNHRRYIGWLGQKLGIRKPGDWYKTTSDDFTKNRGGGFLYYYGGSHVEALKSLFPQKRWHEWLFSAVAPNFWTIEENRHRYLSWLARRLEFKELDDWHRVKQQDFASNAGYGLLHLYNDSPLKLITQCFPEHDWKPWLFSRVAPKFWNKKSNRLLYLKWLAKQLGLTAPEDWYQVTYEDFGKNGGGTLVSATKGNSKLKFLRELYPDYDWVEWRFASTPNDFWKKKSNRVRYLRWLEQQLGIEKPEDWYRVRSRELNGAMLAACGGKVVDAARQLYPKLSWDPIRVAANNKNAALAERHLPVIGYYDAPGNQLKFVKELAGELKIKSLDDWYQVGHESFQDKHGGETLLNRFEGSRIKLLRNLYPDHHWCEWMFNQVPARFWDEPENRQRYMRWLGKRLGYKKTTDWYKLTQDTLVKNRAGGLMDLFSSSPSRIVADYLPDHDWKPWLFVQTHKNFWPKRENRRHYLQWLEKEIGINRVEDWYQITVKVFYNNHGGSFMQRVNNNIIAALRDLYPKYRFLPWKFIQVGKHYWEQKQNRLDYLRWLGKQLGFKRQKDWLQLRAGDLMNNHGLTPWTKYYHGSLVNIVSEMFPNREWLEWEFHSVPQGFYHEKKNRIRFLVWLNKKLRIQRAKQWDSFRKKDFAKHCGNKFVKTYYGNSLDDAIKEAKQAFRKYAKNSSKVLS